MRLQIASYLSPVFMQYLITMAGSVCIRYLFPVIFLSAGLAASIISPNALSMCTLFLVVFFADN